MKNEEEIRLLAEWMLDEALATSSDIRGVSARSLGYTINELSKIQFAYNIEYGTDEIKLFYQKKTDTKGRTFEVKSVTNEMLEIFQSYQNYLKQKRNSPINSFKTMLENRTAIDVKQIEPKEKELTDKQKKLIESLEVD